MDTRRRYRAPDTEVFARLLQYHRLAGLLVEPAPPIEVADAYLDTASGGLLAQGLILRLRSHGGTTTASLRRAETEAGEELAHHRFRADEVDEDALDLPDGPLRDAVVERVGTDALSPLLRFRQYRTPRALYDGERLAGVLSLDVVADQTDPDNSVVSNEVEVELVRGGRESDLKTLDEEILGIGFERDPFSKFERGLIRRNLAVDAPLLLLPRERAALDRLLESESAVERRRAEAILLSAAGTDDRDISRRVGLGPSRVRHWRQAFRLERMRVFDDALPEHGIPEPEPEPEPAFTVTEMVGGEGGVRLEREVAPPQESVEDVLGRVLETLRSQGDAGRSVSGDEQYGAEIPDEPPVLVPPDDRGEVNQDIVDDAHIKESSPIAEKEEADGGSPTWVELDAAQKSPPEPAAIESPGAVTPDPEPAASEEEAPARHHQDSKAAEAVPLPPLAELPPDTALSDGAALVLDAAATALDGASGHDVTDLRTRLVGLRVFIDLFGDVISASDRHRTVKELDATELLLRRLAEIDAAQKLLDPAPDHLADASAQLAFALARTVWSVERRRLYEEFVADSPARRLRDHLRATAEMCRDRVSRSSSNGQPSLVLHVLASAVWRCYEALRTVDVALPESQVDPAELVEKLEALAALTAVIDDPAAREVGSRVASVRDLAIRLLELRVLEHRLDVFLAEWVAPGGSVDPSPLEARRDEVAGDAAVALDRCRAGWASIMSQPFRTLLAQVTAAI